MNRNNRVIWIDIIKTISIVLIIASHVLGTEKVVFQLLFGFNVPCMVIISGYLAGRDNSKTFIDYYKKRVKRIVYPAWLFFALYFLLILIFTFLGGKKQYPYSIKQIIRTFTFMDGIGYTWILAVLLMSTLLIPIIKYLDKRLIYTPQILIVLYIIIGLFFFFFVNDNSKINHMILYFFSYTFLTCFGVFFDRYWKQRTVKWAGGVLIALLFFYVYKTKVFPWYDFRLNKYPPTIYYVAYGTLVFGVFYKLFNRAHDSKNRLCQSIEYLSNNSFDFYLWHIFALYVTKHIESRWIRLFAVLAVSLVLSFVYRNVTTQIKKYLTERRQVK